MSLSVALDASALLPDFKEHATRGIGRYVRELCGYFARCSPADTTVFNFNQVDLVRGGFAGNLIESLPLGRRTLSQQCFYPFRLATGLTQKCDVVHFPAHMDAPAWNPKKYIVTVLDLIPLVLADMYKAAQPSLRFHFARWLEIRAIKNAALVLAISHNTARDVERLLGVPPERIRVTHLGVEQKFFTAEIVPEAKLELKRGLGIEDQAPLVLYVGGIDQRKNVEVLLQVVHRLNDRRRSVGKSAAKLLMVGRIAQDRQYPNLVSAISRLGLQNDIIMPGFVDDQRLLEIYAGSDLFLYPSLYEGFGLPPLEAMASGIPVVSSNTSCMPEVLESAAMLFDPTDAGAMAEAAEAILNDPNLAATLRGKGKEQASKFTWDKTGEATLASYQEFRS